VGLSHQELHFLLEPEDKTAVIGLVRVAKPTTSKKSAGKSYSLIYLNFKKGEFSSDSKKERDIP
jgi:hypothetical protein